MQVDGRSDTCFYTIPVLVGKLLVESEDADRLRDSIDILRKQGSESAAILRKGRQETTLCTLSMVKFLVPTICSDQDGRQDTTLLTLSMVKFLGPICSDQDTGSSFFHHVLCHILLAEIKETARSKSMLV